MDVHIGKHHTENYECGLCHLYANSFEKLETHLLTCEIYRCCICEEPQKTEKTLKKGKEHMETEHEPEDYDSLQHLKLDRNIPDEVKCRNYFWKNV